MSTAFSSASQSSVAPSRDEIAPCARDLWAEAGQPEGRDEEFWLEAEYRLRSARRAPDVTAAILATLSQPVTRPGLANVRRLPPLVTPQNGRGQNRAVTHLTTRIGD